MKLSVCVDALYNGKSFTESMKDIKISGIDAIEFWCWWDKDIEAIKKAKERLGMDVIAFCTRFVSLVDDAMRYSYLEGLKESISVAKQLDCKLLISQVGNELVNISRERQHENIVKGLKACVPILEQTGITLVIEPLNILVDHKGYYLYSSEEAYRIIDEVGSPNVKVLFDIYHQQISEGHLISRISGNLGKIGHFHAAGNPGRHELDKGEINYKEIFKAIDLAGYEGYTGLEYFPVEKPLMGLKSIVEA